MIDPAFPWVALITGALAVLGWGVVLIRALRARTRGVEHRGTAWLVMPLGALLAALGSMSSALGGAVITQTISLDVSVEALSVVASMGRGALAASALIVLASYRPPRG